MSQGAMVLPVVGVISGLVNQGYINTALAALASLNSGASAPSVTNPNLLWNDTTATLAKKRNNADGAWITYATLDYDRWLLADGAAGTPAYGFNAQAGNGLFRAASNSVSMAVNSLTSMNWHGTIGVSVTGIFNSQGGGNGAAHANFTNPGNATPYGFDNQFTAAAPNNNSNYFLRNHDSVGDKCYIYSSGNIVNINNSYGLLSDEKLKDIHGRAGSQWEDVKALSTMMIKYSLKQDPMKKVLLGWSAQEVRDVSPGLVYETPDYADMEEEYEVEVETVSDLVDATGGVKIIKRTMEMRKRTVNKPNGEITLAVAASVAQTKLFKAFGEAQERIESLEAANAALLARLTAIEAKLP